MENNKYKDIKFDFTELKEVIDKLLSDAEKRIKEKNKEQKPKSEIDLLKERIELLESRVSDLECNRYCIPYQAPYFNPGPYTVPPHPVTFNYNTSSGQTITSEPKTKNGWFIPNDVFSFGSTKGVINHGITDKKYDYVTGSTINNITNSRTT